MAVYTDITDAELTAFLADFDLGAPLSFKGIAEGVENSNFLLETERGRFIVTVYERRMREEELPYFVDLMQLAGGRGFPCPTPVADRRGRGAEAHSRQAGLHRHLSERSVGAKRPDTRQCRRRAWAWRACTRRAKAFDQHRPNDLGQSAWAGLFEGQS